MTVTLPKYLIFLSVLPAAWRAIAEIENLDFAYDRFLTKDMENAWLSFTESAELHQMYAQVFEDGKNAKVRWRSPNYMCSYTKVC